MENNISVRAIISGRVQGVFFRMETKRAAERCDVNGWVKNKADGSVEALFEGKKKNVDAVLKWCEKGPPLSKVSGIKTSTEHYKGEYQGFDIAY